MKRALLIVALGLATMAGATACQPGCPVPSTGPVPAGSDYRHGTWYGPDGHAVATANQEDTPPACLRFGGGR